MKQSRTTALILLLLPSIGCVCVLASAGTTGNLLENFGFEEGTGQTNATAWTMSIGGSFREDTNVFGYTDGPYPDGDYALKQFGGNADCFQTNLPVAERIEYELRGMFYHSSIEDIIANSEFSTRMFMHVEWFASDGRLLRHDYSSNHNGAAPSDVWTQIVLRAVAPRSADHATFHVETDSSLGGGAVFGDRFFFGPLNLLRNPSMEYGTGQTNILDWTRGPDTFRDTTNAFGYTDGPLPDGAYALKQFGAGSDLYQTNIPVQGGVAYTAAGQFYHSDIEDIIAKSALSTRMFLHVSWLDAECTPIEDSYSPNHNGLSPANVWSQIVLQAVSPSNACLVTFHVESDKDLGGGSVFGDDFYFAQQEAVPFIEPTGALLVVR